MEQTIEQQRAKFAMDKVNALITVLKLDEQKEFIAYSSGLPAMIHMNGLGQAMAFSKSKGKDRKSYRELYNLVSDWLCQPGQPYAGATDVLSGLTEGDMQHYQLAQAESLMLMSWVKKFSKAFLAAEE
jgi:CRISPR-associated protein Cmr5